VSGLIAPAEVAYRRSVLLAVELLDALTLTRIRGDIRIEAVGLMGKPVVNSGGCYVWLAESTPVVQKITVDPRGLPYAKVELAGANVTFPLTIIELHPTVRYEFSPGVTGLRGTLIESMIGPVQPVVDGEVKLRWLDDVGVWQESPTVSRTDGISGDFVSFFRLDPNEKPNIDSLGRVTVKLHVRRGAFTRTSVDQKLLAGRVTDPTTLKPLNFAWDDMLP